MCLQCILNNDRIGKQLHFASYFRSASAARYSSLNVTLGALISHPAGAGVYKVSHVTQLMARKRVNATLIFASREQKCSCSTAATGAYTEPATSYGYVHVETASSNCENWSIEWQILLWLFRNTIALKVTIKIDIPPRTQLTRAP